MDAPIDLAQLKVLLWCYYRLSMRGGVTRNMRHKDKSPAKAFRNILLFYVLMGFAFSVNAAFLDLFTYSLMLHAMTFFIVGLAIASESGEILFNRLEAEILLHRPISQRTLLAAKLLNLLAFSGSLAGALNLFPVAAVYFTAGSKPWTPVVFAISTIGICLFCSAAVIVSYGLITTVFGRERFETLATWSQIVMSALVIMGYQIMPHIIRRMDAGALDDGGWQWLLLLLPFGWFAALDLNTSGGGGVYHLSASLLAIFVPLLLSIFAVTKLAGAYNDALVGIRERVTRRRPVTTTIRAGTKPPFLLRWWLRDPLEAQAFRLTTAYLWRDREVKLRLYPSLTPFFMFPLFTVMSQSAFNALMSYAMLGMLPIMVLETLRYSAHPAAADIFESSPLESAAPLFHGTRKAILICLIVPSGLLLTLFFLAVISNPGETLVLAIPLVFLIPVLSLLPAVFDEYLPLSRPITTGGQSGRMFLLSFISFLGPGGILLTFYLARRNGLFLATLGIEIVLMTMLYWSLHTVIRRRPLARFQEG